MASSSKRACTRARTSLTRANTRIIPEHEVLEMVMLEMEMQAGSDNKEDLFSELEDFDDDSVNIPFSKLANSRRPFWGTII